MGVEYWNLIEKFDLDAIDIHKYEDELFDTFIYFQLEFERLLKLNTKIHQINPVLFYIKNTTICNAFAGRVNGQNIMGITQGYPVLMNEKYKDNLFEKIIYASFLNEKEVSDGFSALYASDSFSFNQYMLDCSIHFTFYHEFRHLLQFNALNTKDDMYLSENLSQREFDLNKHVLEYDADKYAAHQIVLFAASMYRRLGLKSTGIFKSLIYCSLGSLIITRALFNYGLVDQWQDPFELRQIKFYTKDNWHPHSSVRALNLLDSFYVSISDGFPDLNIDTQDLVTNGFGIAKLYFDKLLPHTDTTELIFNDMFAFTDESNKYNDFLHSEALKNKAITKLIKQ